MANKILRQRKNVTAVIAKRLKRLGQSVQKGEAVIEEWMVRREDQIVFVSY